MKVSLKSKKRYDIGIYGWWGHENFGGCLTYFALNRALQKMNYSVLMVQEAFGESPRYKIPESSIAMNFAKKNYDFSEQPKMSELGVFNKMCDKFVLGGDQMWNNLIPFVKEDNFLNFVWDQKLKISYSASFGNRDHNPPAWYLQKAKPLLARFDAISVRENYAADIAKKIYGAHAVPVIDAVFLLQKSEYVLAAKSADAVLPKKYLFAFILNPSEKKKRQIELISQKLGLQILCCPDAAAAYHKSFYEIFQGVQTLAPLSVENFLAAYENASYVVTDSFHGTCFCYIFKKPFSVYYNAARGTDRFLSLMETLKLQGREIKEDFSDEEILQSEKIGFEIDWTLADENVKKECQFSEQWLKNALETDLRLSAISKNLCAVIDARCEAVKEHADYRIELRRNEIAKISEELEKSQKEIFQSKEILQGEMQELRNEFSLAKAERKEILQKVCRMEKENELEKNKKWWERIFKGKKSHTK